MKWNLVLAGAGLIVAASLCGCGGSERNESGRLSVAARSDVTDESRPDPVAAAPSAATANACPSGAELLFGCRVTASAKSATLCITRSNRPATTYRFGSATRTELVAADADPANRTTFHRTSLTFAGATGGYVYSFRNADTTYALYAISGNEGLSRAGIAVLDASGRKQADLECDPATLQETGSMALIRQTRSWTPDPAAANAVR